MHRAYDTCSYHDVLDLLEIHLFIQAMTSLNDVEFHFDKVTPWSLPCPCTIRYYSFNPYCPSTTFFADKESNEGTPYVSPVKRKSSITRLMFSRWKKKVLPVSCVLHVVQYIMTVLTSTHVYGMDVYLSTTMEKSYRIPQLRALIGYLKDATCGNRGK